MPDPNQDVIERFDPAVQQGEMVEAEHFSRYRWATQFAQGRRVLDIACGVAYGSRWLSQAGAVQVVGVDIDVATVEQAQTLADERVSFRVGDICDLPFTDGSFDLIVCFETIEHVDDPERALDELKRVLGGAGLLLISTPNRGIYPPGNPHHRHEYTADELEMTLRTRFAHVRLRRQHTWVSSGVFNDGDFSAGLNEPIGGIEMRKAHANVPGQEIYTLAIATDGDVTSDHPVVTLTSDAEIKVWDELWHEQNSMLNDQRRLLEEQATQLDEQTHQLNDQRRLLEEQATQLDEQRQVLEDQHATLNAQTALIAEHERCLMGSRRSEDELRRERNELRSALLSTESDISKLVELERENAELMDIAQELRDSEDRSQALAARCEAAARERDDLAVRYDVLVNSRSWRSTRLLRSAGALLHRGR